MPVFDNRLSLDVVCYSLKCLAYSILLTVVLIRLTGCLNEVWIVLNQVAAMLHQRGISFIQQDTFGCTPLHYACLQCSLPLVEFILGKYSY